MAQLNCLSGMLISKLPRSLQMPALEVPLGELSADVAMLADEEHRVLLAAVLAPLEAAEQHAMLLKAAEENAQVEVA